MKKINIVLISFAFLVAAVMYLANLNDTGNQNLIAVVYVNGAVTHELPLGTSDTITILTEYGFNILEIDSDGIKIVDANCPTQVCVHTSKQTTAGGTIACLPHRVMVKLIGNPSSVDAISR